MKAQLFFSAIVVTLVPTSFAEEPKASAPAVVEEEVQIVEGVECKNGPDVRRLEVHTREAGCTLQYFKAGKPNQIALARRGVEVCKTALKKVRTTLEGSSFQCK